MTIRNFIKTFYIRSTGYSYTNLGRLFLRLFVGIMLIQFAVKQIATYSDICNAFPSVAGLDSHTSLIVMICIETICSIFIMFGFLFDECYAARRINVACPADHDINIAVGYNLSA